MLTETAQELELV